MFLLSCSTVERVRGRPFVVFTEPGRRAVALEGDLPNRVFCVCLAHMTQQQRGLAFKVFAEDLDLLRRPSSIPVVVENGLPELMHSCLCRLIYVMFLCTSPHG